MRNRQYAQLIWLLTFFTGLTLVINVCIYQGYAQQFYLELQYSILALFIAFPLVCDILPAYKNISAIGILSKCAILCFIRIHDTAVQYTERLNWQRSVLKDTKGKLIISEQKVPMPLLKMSWGSAFEFWALSTLKEKETRSIIIEEQPNEFD